MASPNSWNSEDYDLIATAIAQEIEYDPDKMRDEDLIFDLMLVVQKSVLPEAKWKQKTKIPTSVMTRMMSKMYQIKKPEPKVVAPEPPAPAAPNPDHERRLKAMELSMQQLAGTLNRIEKRQQEQKNTPSVNQLVEDENTERLNKLLERVNALSALKDMFSEQKTLYQQVLQRIDGLDQQIVQLTSRVDDRNLLIHKLAEIREVKGTLVGLNQKVTHLFTELGYNTDMPPQKPVKVEHPAPVPEPSKQILTLKATPVAVESPPPPVEEKVTTPKNVALPKIPMILVGFQAKNERMLLDEYGETFDFTVISNTRSAKQMGDSCRGKLVLMLYAGTSKLVRSVIHGASSTVLVIKDGQGLTAAKNALDTLMFEQQQAIRNAAKG